MRLRYLVGVVVGLCIGVAGGALGANCDVGWYVDGGGCAQCTSAMFAYCPDGVNRVSCPPNDTDYGKYLSGATVDRMDNRGFLNGVLSDAKNCHSDVWLDMPGGKLLWQCDFEGVDYSRCESQLWYEAKAGYYLSNSAYSSFKDWWRGVKPCTNAPRNSHYTGPGTPDSADGAVKDANDCPYECDDGYDCQRPCGAGIRTINSSTGASIKLWDRMVAKPSLAVRYNDITCYANMDAGAANGTINISVDGVVYHLAD